MSKADSWMPLWIADYQADTMHLNTTQHGAYILLLMHHWRAGGVPDDISQLAAITRCDQSLFRRSIWPVLCGFFTKDGGCLVQKRALAERALAEELTEKRSTAGKEGAKRRWGKSNFKDGTDGKAMAKPLANASQTQWQDDAPSPSPSPSPKVDSPPFIPPAPPEPEAGMPSAPVGERSSISEPAGFSAFWDAYPSEARTAPDYALKAYAKALQFGATAAQIVAALARDIEIHRAAKRHLLPPAAWLKGGSWRMIAEAPAAPANVAPIDRRFDGWETADHMELAKWRAARECGWRTKSADHNALDEDARHRALWDHLTGYRPRVARFLTQHEPDGVPIEVAA